jgi:hypothetical protein
LSQSSGSLLWAGARYRPVVATRLFAIWIDRPAHLLIPKPQRVYHLSIRSWRRLPDEMENALWIKRLSNKTTFPENTSLKL